MTSIFYCLSRSIGSELSGAQATWWTRLPKQWNCSMSQWVWTPMETYPTNAYTTCAPNLLPNKHYTCVGLLAWNLCCCLWLVNNYACTFILSMNHIYMQQVKNGVFIENKPFWGVVRYRGKHYEREGRGSQKKIQVTIALMGPTKHV